VGRLVLKSRHRLMCGDSRCHLPSSGWVMLTDPPYGLGDSATGKNDYDVASDTVDDLDDLLRDVICPSLEVVKRGVITCGNKNQYRYPVPSWTMAWFCPAGTGRGPWGFCCWQPVLCYGKDAKLEVGEGSHPDAIVHQEGPSSDLHPCAKPMDFWRWLLRRVTSSDDHVYDPFSGSGTTLIACEMAGMTSTSVEMSPSYCDVAIQRVKNLTGEDAVLWEG
jgi:hypothetical protein